MKRKVKRKPHYTRRPSYLDYPLVFLVGVIAGQWISILLIMTR